MNTAYMAHRRLHNFNVKRKMLISEWLTSTFPHSQLTSSRLHPFSTHVTIRLEFLPQPNSNLLFSQFIPAAHRDVIETRFGKDESSFQFCKQTANISYIVLPHYQRAL
jgi:hypothetical protein